MTIEKSLKEEILKDIDCIAENYTRYQDEEVKKATLRDYKVIRRTYNQLIKNLFGEDVLKKYELPLFIEQYDEQRKDGKWDKW